MIVAGVAAIQNNNRVQVLTDTGFHSCRIGFRYSYFKRFVRLCTKCM